VEQRFRAAALAALGCLLFAGTSSGADGPLQIGMVQSMFRDVQPAIVQALARPFRSLMEKQTGLSYDVELCPDSLAMVKRFKEQKIELGVMHGFEYAWIKAKNPDLVPVSVALPNGGIVQAMVVVHEDCKAAGIAELDGESVLIPRGTKAHCMIYLEKLRAGVPKTAARTLAKPGLTPEEALNLVANGEAPAALVDAASLAAYKVLQPGASKRVKVLAQSDHFPPVLILTRKGAMKDEAITKLRDGLSVAHKTAQYKPLMMMWNMQGFENVPKDYDAQLEKCLQQYPVPNVPPATETSQKE
jgi:ABC-type phosphate/phosphonate transport system substrate-binding protein